MLPQGLPARPLLQLGRRAHAVGAGFDVNKKVEYPRYGFRLCRVRSYSRKHSNVLSKAELLFVMLGHGPQTWGVSD